MAASPDPRRSKAANARRTTAKQRRHQHVLDVSVRTTHAARQRRSRLFGVVSKLLLIVGVGAGLYFGVRKGIALLLLKNPEYNLSVLNVETDGVLTPEAVVEACDLHKGANIFLINLNRAKARVEALPQVEKAQVTRQLPNRITIQVNERKPIAWVAPEHAGTSRSEIVKAPGAYLIDAHSILLPAQSPSPQDEYLPVIRNYHGLRSAGQEAEGEEIKAALDLLHAQQDSMIAARFQIQDIDLSKQFGLEVTDRNGLQVLFGLDDMDRQLKRLDVDLQVLDQSPQKPQTINLLVQKNVPVTFVTEPAADAPSSNPPAAPLASPLLAKEPTPGKGNTTDGVKGSKAGNRNDKNHTKSIGPANSRRPRHSQHGLQPFSPSP